MIVVIVFLCSLGNRLLPLETVEPVASLRFLSSTSWPVQLLDFEALRPLGGPG